MGATCGLCSRPATVDEDVDPMQLPSVQRKGTPLTNDELVDAIVEAQSLLSTDEDKKSQKKAMINLDLVETMLLEEEAAENGNAELKRSNERKGTNFVTKQDVEEAARVSLGKDN